MQVVLLCNDSDRRTRQARSRIQVLAAMNPSRIVRAKVRRLTDLPNVGPIVAADFEMLGYSEPGQLRGADPFELYRSLCVATGTRQDPCVLDVFMSVTSFLDGGLPEPWWYFTPKRKQRYGNL